MTVPGLQLDNQGTDKSKLQTHERALQTEVLTSKFDDLIILRAYKMAGENQKLSFHLHRYAEVLMCLYSHTYRQIKRLREMIDIFIKKNNCNK